MGLRTWPLFRCCCGFWLHWYSIQDKMHTSSASTLTSPWNFCWPGRKRRTRLVSWAVGSLLGAGCLSLFAKCSYHTLSSQGHLDTEPYCSWFWFAGILGHGMYPQTSAHLTCPMLQACSQIAHSSTIPEHFSGSRSYSCQKRLRRGAQILDRAGGWTSTAFRS